MTDKELKKLSRTDLLEMLIEVSKENETLQSRIEEQAEQYENQIEELNWKYQKKIDEQKKKLEDRTLSISKAGSLAEACLQINGVFEAAQAAAEQYLVNVRQQEGICEELQKTTELKIADQMATAERQAQKTISDAETNAAEIVNQATQKAEALLADAKVRASSYWDEVSKRLSGFYKEYKGLQDMLNVGGSDDK